MTEDRLKQAFDESLQWAKGDFGFHKMFRSQYSALPLEKDIVAYSTDETNGAPYVLLHCDEEVMFKAGGRKYCLDIVTIKDGKRAFTDVSIDSFRTTNC
ncbi:hypothetical protein [Bartonella taylorii]|uniref:Uncharacterized protein n=1 Tax=Bartonella taylorii TaxID=33046 RepID=A0A9Q8YWB2_BARTA|nr:hypothetical protein [Bartonella taylorii]OPB34959.1 hypothetical protein Btaycd_009960 [Bartonella taylorii]USP02263.1 hypothetical protein LAJ60_05125 [Bartonella taylorii]